MNKVERYQQVLVELRALLAEPMHLIGQMATMVAVLHEQFEHYDWTGFYCVTAPEKLEIGPYQGHLACTHIDFNRGVCGAAATQRQTVIVPDVREFPGYIACSVSTLSEIVVPVFYQGKLHSVLDIDSNDLNAFDSIDQQYLEAAVRLFH